MIALTLAEIAAVVSGEVVAPEDAAAAGAADVVVTGPVVIDSREAGPGSLFAAFVGEHSDGHDHAEQAARRGAVAVLGSRATMLATVVVDDVRDALQRLAAHVVTRVRARGALSVVAITGSQGKTSTKDLLGAVLGQAGPTVVTRGSFNNELGMPLTALGIAADTRFLVLELGARGIGHVAELARLVPPDVGVVLNVGQAHLGEFGSREAIAQAKGELVEAVVDGGTAVLNADDARVAAMAARTAQRVLTFGAEQPADVRVEELRLDRLGRPSFVLAAGEDRVPVTLQLVGAHQALNAAAAAAAALALGVPAVQVGRALDAVATLSQWRMELRELASGVTVLNDTYNANPDSMRAALDALAAIGADPAVRRTIAVLGEMRELGAASEAEHAAIGGHAAAVGIDEVLVIGEPARDIQRGLVARNHPATTFVADNAEAVAWLRDHVGAGDAVLLKASRGARLDEVAASLE